VEHGFRRRLAQLPSSSGAPSLARAHRPRTRFRSPEARRAGRARHAGVQRGFLPSSRPLGYLRGC
jgi:hypothetical protein